MGMDYLITETHADTKKNWKLLTVDGASFAAKIVPTREQT